MSENKDFLFNLESKALALVRPAKAKALDSNYEKHGFFISGQLLLLEQDIYMLCSDGLSDML